MAAGSSAQRPAEVAALIRNQRLEECLPYLQEVISDLRAPVAVVQSIEASGKGVRAMQAGPSSCMQLMPMQLPQGSVCGLQAFAEDQLVFREPVLVGVQHAANRDCARVCSSCFRFIGSLEAQLSLVLSQQLPGLGQAGALSGCSADTCSCRRLTMLVALLQVTWPACRLQSALRCQQRCS